MIGSKGNSASAPPIPGLASAANTPYKRGMLDYMQKGGPLMWLIVFCSVLAGAVFLDRVTYFHRAQIRVGEFIRGLATLLRHRSFAEARIECEGTPGPVARVILAAL